MSHPDPIAVAQNLRDTAYMCSDEQLALRARLLQGADVIVRLHAELTETTKPDPSLPMFLRKQAS